MENQIPQSFKVQWLNTILKFIKDDTQLVKDYPQMPSSHVEYLHNLIVQHKDDLGLGFKSLYSSVWEAMKIYSVKYKFKIVIQKSEDGESGYFKIEKIPKTVESAKILNEEKKDNKNNDEKKEKDNETIQKYQVPKELLEPEAVKCKQEESQQLKKAKTKKSLPKISKGLKMFMENQKMLDSLSPLFIKTTLKSILEFLTDDLSASKIFSNLAPIESRFLENFLSICQRKTDLEALLSPACNEILAEISNRLNVFNKNFRLDISAVVINTNTNTREVKYTKTPTFPSKKKSKQNLLKNTIQAETATMYLKDPTKLLNVPSSKEDKFNITLEKNLQNDTIKGKSKKKKVIQNTASAKNKKANSEPTDKVIETINNKIDNEPKTNKYLKSASLNKSGGTPNKSISFTKEGTSATVDTPYIKTSTLNKINPKMKILQDMSVPLTSDKGLRMMQLMGWKGGALGPRGEGITEPIIPKVNYNNSGLGHVAVKTDSSKETKKNVQIEFINKILDMIDNNEINMSVIKLEKKLIKREIRFWKLTIKSINERMNLDTEFEIRSEIKVKMIQNPDLMFNIDFEDDNRTITITKTSKTEMEKIHQEKIKEDRNSDEIATNVVRNRNNRATFNTIVMKSILELVNNEDNEILVQFNMELKAKYINQINTMILLINERQNVKMQNNCRAVAELAAKVLEVIGDIELTAKIYESERYIVIGKKYPKRKSSEENFKTVMKMAETDVKSAFDYVRSHLSNKRKNKLVKALYKYEMKNMEEFEENQWYDTVEKTLLDREVTYDFIYCKTENINSKEYLKKELIKEKNNIKHDQNNNGCISVNMKIVCEDVPSKELTKSDLLLQAFEKVRD